MMGGTLSITNEYNTIGSKSIQSTKSIDMNYIINDDEIGKTGVISFNTYALNSFNAALLFREDSSSGLAVRQAYVDVPGNENVTVTFTIPKISSSTYSIFVRIINESKDVFADNFILKLM